LIPCHSAQETAFLLHQNATMKYPTDLLTALVHCLINVHSEEALIHELYTFHLALYNYRTNKSCIRGNFWMTEMEKCSSCGVRHIHTTCKGSLHKVTTQRMTKLKMVWLC